MNTPQQEDVESSLREARKEAAQYREALELIAADPGGIPEPRVFAADVLAGNVIIQAALSPAQRSSNPQQEKNER